MIVIMESTASDSDVEKVIEELGANNVKHHQSEGENYVVIGALGHNPQLDSRRFGLMDGVNRVIRVSSPYKLVSRIFEKRSTFVEIGNSGFKSRESGAIVTDISDFVNSAEDLALLALRAQIKKQGGQGGSVVLLGPVTMHHDSVFNDHGKFIKVTEADLRDFRSDLHANDVSLVCSVVSVSDFNSVREHVDGIMLQESQMDNFAMLAAAGASTGPVILTRSPAATIEEWLVTADMIVSAGNPNVVLCESGLRSFDPMTTRTLDLGGIAAVIKNANLPVIANVSKAVGDSDLVRSVAQAALVAGSCGVVVSVGASEDIHQSSGAISIGELEQIAVFQRRIIGTSRTYFAGNKDRRKGREARAKKA